MSKSTPRVEAMRAAIKVNEAESAFREAFKELWQTIPRMPLDGGQFWCIMSDFRRIYGRSLSLCGPRGASEHACDEFVRQSVNEERRHRTLGDCMKFTRQWDLLTDKMYQPLFNVIKSKNDDSYGDFLDAFPLAGKEVIDRALTTGNKGFEVESDITDALSKDNHRKIIWEGENYFRMNLEDACRKFYLYGAKQSSFELLADALIR